MKICQVLHSIAIGCHSGFQVTYQKIKGLFAWTKMKKMIKDFVAQCVIVGAP
jgi:hypothetical protein